MSRSRKKIPIVKDYSRGNTKFCKRMASKAVRRYKNPIADGKMFTKIYPSWNIFDYKWFAQVSEVNKKYPDNPPEARWATTYEDVKAYYRK